MLVSVYNVWTQTQQIALEYITPLIQQSLKLQTKHIANGPFLIAGHMHNISYTKSIVPTNHFYIIIYNPAVEVDLKTRLSS